MARRAPPVHPQRDHHLLPTITAFSALPHSEHGPEYRHDHANVFIEDAVVSYLASTMSVKYC
jgi:hypothetical protein